MINICQSSSYNSTETKLSTAPGAEDTDMDDDFIIKDFDSQPDTYSNKSNDGDRDQHHTDEECTSPILDSRFDYSKPHRSNSEPVVNSSSYSNYLHQRATKHKYRSSWTINQALIIIRLAKNLLTSELQMEIKSANEFWRNFPICLICLNITKVLITSILLIAFLT